VVAIETYKDISDVREQFRAQGQDHVFRFWDRLDPAGRERLGLQTARLADGLGELLAGQRRALRSLESPSSRALTPAPVISLPEYGGDPERFERAQLTGSDLLHHGRVAAFVVAGGQGSRLGFDGPKGAYPIGPVTSRCLFEIQAQKIRGLIRRFGRPVPWYVMTSDSTDADTRSLFERSDYFGLSERDVFIFSQQMVPACDFDGMLMLTTPDEIFESPNGHGGSLTALESSGALDDMDDRGIDRIFYYQVDNPLIRMCDPVYLGFHEEHEAEMSCKAIRRIDPTEKVGVFAEAEGHLRVIEYTELGAQERDLRGADGKLSFWAGNSAIHVFNTDFVRRLAGQASELLPLHASAKKIPVVDDAGRPVEVTQRNGYKLERFVFDALPAARRTCVVEVRVNEEFSPIKNAEGKNSPESSRADLVKLYRAWLKAAGIDIEADTSWIEIDHGQIDSADDALASGLASVSEAGDVIQVATGMES
jgi:UDP-N-acetylglucosamine/UDP-N-acetylgalactosamine diphosphorylase